MRWMKLLGVVASGLLFATATSAQQPLLQLQGQPYFGGSMTLHVTAPNAIGQLVTLAIGLNPLPLDAPAYTSKGPFYIGNLTSVFALGAIAGNGRFDLSFTMPGVIPGAEGIPVALQAYVAPSLSNPATLPLDLPYLQAALGQTIASPNPVKKAQFGYIVQAGDFNGDGNKDLAVSAAYETYQGITDAGRAYVLWGPDFATSITLSSSNPRPYGFFGISLTVTDLDSDGLDDLVVGETAGQPASWLPNLHVFLGGTTLSPTASFLIVGPGTGNQYSGYTHTVAAGDFNADGFQDLAVGNNKAPINSVFEGGQIDVYLGPDFTDKLAIANPDPQFGDGFASWLVAADMNDDGVDDLVEISSGATVATLGAVGIAHVCLGPGLGIDSTLPCPAPLGAGTGFGIALFVADVIGNDEVLDIIAGDFQDRVFVLRGPSFEDYVVLDKPPATVPNPFGESAYGWSLGAGDVNGDGIRDLLIGDWFEGEQTGCPASSEGTVFAALGPYFRTACRVQDMIQACGDDFGRSFLFGSLDQEATHELVVGVHLGDDVGLVNNGHVTRLRAAATASD